jgi:hypothetical protein
MVDYVPPSPWKIDIIEEIIPSNQEKFLIGLRDCSSLKSRAVSSGVVDAEGDIGYMPPMGWTIVVVSRDAGSSWDKLAQQRTLWITPEGEAICVEECNGSFGGIVTKDTKEQIPTIPAKTMNPLWLLLGTVAIFAWALWPSGKK